MCVNTTPAANTQTALFQFATPAAKGGVNEETGLYFDERELRPLPRYVLAALDLNADEKENSEVIVLSGDQYPDETPAEQCVSRLAVCRPVPRAEWGKLAPGAVVIYTEAYHFSVQERPHTAHIPVLASLAGTVQFSHEGRELLCTSTWCGNHDEAPDHRYSEVYEIWEVTRFISLPQVK